MEKSLFLSPERLIPYFGLKPGDTVADFGAGHGHFTIPLARAVGPKGKVYAIDVQRDVLDIVEARAKLEHLLDVESVWTDLELAKGSKLNEASVHFVLISNILFQAQEKLNIMLEAYRILRPKGKVAVIEWAPAAAPFGPPPGHRIPQEQVKEFATRVGFRLDRPFDAGSHHYGLLFIKK